MPSEDVGTCGDARWPDRAAIGRELEFGIACLRRHCGTEPIGTSLEVVWHEHDLGAYASIGLVWDRGELSEEHWEYIGRCSDTLDALDDYIDWDALHTALRVASDQPQLASEDTDEADWPDLSNC